MKCHKCNCEATEDNWIGGFKPFSLGVLKDLVLERFRKEK